MNKLFRPPFFLVAIAIALAFCLATPLQAQVSTWTGGSPPIGGNSNWSTSANWAGGAIPGGNTDMTFAGNLRTTNNNDFSPNQISLNFLDFASGADPFTLQGSPVQFTHPAGTNTITNHSANLQTLDFNGAMSVQVKVTINAASGDIRINNGLFLQAFQTNSADLTVTGSHNTNIAGIISDDPNLNPAGIIKNGSGTLTLSGNNTFRGNVTINNGTVDVGSTNALGAGNTIIFGALPQFGVLETAGSAPRTFNVGHDFTILGGAPFNILSMKVGGTNSGVNTDRMNVGHDAFLSGELFVHQINNFMPFAGAQVTIIHTADPTGRNGTFQVTESDFPGLIQPTPVYFADHVDVRFDLSASFASQAETRNQLCVGENLDAAAALGNNSEAAAVLVRFVGNIAPADLPAAFDLLAPEELSSIYEISFSHAILESANFQHRLSDIRLGVTGYCQLGEAVVETKDAKDGKTVVDKNGPVVETCPDKRWGVFATGYGQAVQVDDDANARGYEISTGGFTTGADYRISDHFAIGVGGGYAHSNTQIGGDLDVSTAYAGVYATAFAGGFYVDATANGGWSDIDTSRFGLGGTETGNTDGAEFNGLIGVGYDWKHNCWTLGAFGNFQYTYVEFNSFDESETSVAPLHFPDQNQTAEHSRLGLKVAYDGGKGNTIFRPEVRVAWQHEFGDTDYAIDWSFLNISDDHICSVFGPQTGDDSALIDAGFSLIFSRCHNVSAYVFYNGNVGRDSYSRHGATGGLRVNF